MVIVIIFVLVLFGMGILEKWIHQQRINTIPIRINVNGVRGKSTVTRLITGLVQYSGKKTIGKTTGTQAKMIFPYEDKEVPILRPPAGPNINEQKRVIKTASELEAKVLVSECMAVNPDYQHVFQKDLFQGNIGVIVNVLEDHMDVMGPTLDEVAEAFTSTIPYNGWLVISEGLYQEYFTEIAERRQTKTIIVKNEWVSEEYLRRFPYMLFPENVALALGVAQALDIDEETALLGMLTAPQDPGAMSIHPIDHLSEQSLFVNGFAANDAASTLNIWRRLRSLGYPIDNTTVIMNCRADRVDRTEQFARDVLPYLSMKQLILIGEAVDPITEAYSNGQIFAETLTNLEGKKTEDILSEIKIIQNQSILFGIGNIHGAAEPLVDVLEEKQVVVKEMEQCLEPIYISH